MGLGGGLSPQGSHLRLLGAALGFTPTYSTILGLKTCFFFPPPPPEHSADRLRAKLAPEH